MYHFAYQIYVKVLSEDRFEHRWNLNFTWFSCLPPRGPFYWHGLTLIPAWVSNYIHYKVWDDITYPFLNFSGYTVEV